MDDRTPPPKVTGSFSLGVVGVGTVGLTGSRYCSVRAGPTSQPLLRQRAGTPRLGGQCSGGGGGRGRGGVEAVVLRVEVDVRRRSGINRQQGRVVWACVAMRSGKGMSNHGVGNMVNGHLSRGRPCQLSTIPETGSLQGAFDGMQRGGWGPCMRRNLQARKGSGRSGGRSWA